jgi:hypothetical protein
MKSTSPIFKRTLWIHFCLTLVFSSIVSQDRKANGQIINPDQALLAAIKKGEIKVVEKLLRAGANPNAITEDGDTPLMLAAIYADAGCMKSLLNKGANPNFQNKAGATALMWAVANAEKVKPRVKSLLLEQRADGGWSQLTTLESDAYATGQVLYSLHQAGKLSTKAPAYRRGLEFLLRSQGNDGSWFIRSRSFPAIPFVESGFPYDKNQFISAAGSSWATMALTLALPHKNAR